MQGEPGVNGANGERGFKGETGANGEHGFQGYAGINGANGKRGLQGERGDMANLTSENILKAFTDNEGSGMDQFVIAMMNGDIGRRFMTSFMALKARETTKSITGARKMKDTATGTDDASAALDTSESKKKSRIPSLRRKGSKKKFDNDAAALDDTVRDDTISSPKSGDGAFALEDGNK